MGKSGETTYHPPPSAPRTRVSTVQNNRPVKLTGPRQRACLKVSSPHDLLKRMAPRCEAEIFQQSLWFPMTLVAM